MQISVMFEKYIRQEQILKIHLSNTINHIKKWKANKDTRCFNHTNSKSHQFLIKKIIIYVNIPVSVD